MSCAGLVTEITGGIVSSLTLRVRDAVFPAASVTSIKYSYIPSAIPSVKVAGLDVAIKSRGKSERSNVPALEPV